MTTLLAVSIVLTYIAVAVAAGAYAAGRVLRAGGVDDDAFMCGLAVGITWPAAPVAIVLAMMLSSLGGWAHRLGRAEKPELPEAFDHSMSVNRSRS